MNIIAPFSRSVNDILVISDLHAPYQHPDALTFLEAAHETVDPDLTVGIGDEADLHGLNRYGIDPDLYSAGDEFTATLKVFDRLEKFIPKMHLVWSNHLERYVKAATSRAGIPRSMVKTSHQELYQRKNWIWHPSLEIQTPTGPVTFKHSVTTNALRGALLLGNSLVQGHYHSTFEIGWADVRGRQIFGMTVGCLVDRESYAFAYAHEDRFAQFLGCGALIGGEPRLIRMGLKKSGRWDNKIWI